MKKLLILFLIISGIYGKTQTLKITVYNKTGYDVDSLSLQSIYIGHMEKGDSITLTLKNKEINMEDGLPFFPIADGKVIGLKKAMKDSTAKEPISYGFCGRAPTSLTLVNTVLI